MKFLKAAGGFALVGTARSNVLVGNHEPTALVPDADDINFAVVIQISNPLEDRVRCSEHRTRSIRPDYGQLRLGHRRMEDRERG